MKEAAIRVLSVLLSGFAGTKVHVVVHLCIQEKISCTDTDETGSVLLEESILFEKC